MQQEREPIPVKTTGELMASSIAGGASPVHARVDADFYPTPPECVVALLKWLDGAFPTEVWEPACGDGAISQVLKAFGFTVWSTDLHDRGYGRAGIDFLTMDVQMPVITNPPFSLAEQFIRHARTANQPFAMLLKATYWHTKNRKPLFDETGPFAVLPLTWRPNFIPTRGKSPTMDVCWTVWSARVEPVCRYIPLMKPSPADMKRIAHAI